jgi:hypothetical protein
LTRATQKQGWVRDFREQPQAELKFDFNFANLYGSLFFSKSEARDRGGMEIDLLLERGRELHAFEIKSARTWHAAFGRNVVKFGRNVAAVRSSAVIYAGEPVAGSEERPACVNFMDAAALFD